MNITLDADKDDELLDDAEEESNAQPNKEGKARLRSTIGKTDDSGRKIKGRGFAPQKQQSEEERYGGGRFDTASDDERAGPLRCKLFSSCALAPSPLNCDMHPSAGFRILHQYSGRRLDCVCVRRS